MAINGISRREFLKIVGVGTATLPVLDVLVKTAYAQPPKPVSIEAVVEGALKNPEPLTYVRLLEGKKDLDRIKQVSPHL